ncbi:FIST N-terminal domain-containing protein [Litorisediminicola beolgyonensis]|uniref:FIST N-terminal domain-containing protein n=1 Tax=Litorisediminicola beolgyonensis TaxID=1173614 RepID=A0ABW3ZM78_9RHOB
MRPAGAGHLSDMIRVAQIDHAAPDALDRLVADLGPGPFSLVCLFVTPQAQFAEIVARTETRFGAAEVLACTTAGEIGRGGYEEGQIVALGFPKAQFRAVTRALDDLAVADERTIGDLLLQERMALTNAAEGMAHEFAFLMVDGLSMREEHLTHALAAGLGSMPLFGGSSGDGDRFRETYLARNGAVLNDAAVLALVRTRCPVRVFSLDNMVPTETRMVVTGADPARRVVTEINAEPAAQEYARLLGKDPAQLDPFTFAAHPVVVRLGDSHHTRAIQRVNEAGELVFFSAINEGMVLTLADHDDISTHLDQALSRFAPAGQAPELILGCDCILRRIEAGQSQKTRDVSSILQKHKVFGFSTYGEQIGALHVNQTLTGVAFYPPDTDGAECP